MTFTPSQRAHNSGNVLSRLLTSEKCVASAWPASLFPIGSSEITGRLVAHPNAQDFRLNVRRFFAKSLDLYHTWIMRFFRMKSLPL